MAVDIFFALAVLCAVASPIAWAFGNAGICAYLMAMALFLLLSAVLLLLYSERR